MKDILAMSAAQTYDLVKHHFVHAYPDKSPYPQGDSPFFIPIGPGGTMENLFKIVYFMVCDPADLGSKKEELERIDPFLYKTLLSYNEERNSFYGYSEGKDYVFLFLFPICAIRQPFVQHIRNAKYFSVDEIPLIGQGNHLKPVQTGKTWIFSYNQSFDIHWAMSLLPSIDWDVRNKAVKGKVKKGDVVYLYGAAPEQAIKYRCRVVEADKTETTVDDSEFGGNPAGTPCDCVELELECTYEDDGIPYKALLEHGLKKGVLTKRRIEDPDLFAFLREYDADDNHIENWLRSMDRDHDEEDNELSETEEIIEEIDALSLKGEEKEALVKVRVNQGIFRDRLLKHYPNKCCLCGVESPQLLIASHIKPWSECKEDERLDPNNGFLMCPSHDKLFDRHLITFKDDGSIQISDSLSANDVKGMHVKAGMKIKLTAGNRKYLKVHRKTFKEMNKKR